MMPRFKLSLNTDGIERVLDQIVDGGPVVALIYNDARSSDGTYYWKFVNNGRGPVVPIRAKVLHWIDPATGKDVFAHYARGVAPRHMRENAIAAIRQMKLKPSGKLGRDLIVQFVNNVAQIAVDEMAARTPKSGFTAQGKTGSLADSYRIVRAE